jgi:hypothetical protein
VPGGAIDTGKTKISVTHITTQFWQLYDLQKTPTRGFVTFNKSRTNERHSKSKERRNGVKKSGQKILQKANDRR